jgi:dihydrofolate synthase/folylpolyglutamate synthase
MTNTYGATLDYLFHQLPMFQRVGPKAFKKDLTNIIALCRALGDPQEQFTSIHIAGTNGKGSTTHMMGAILQAAGLRVGLYTSPHYRDFRERIKINGTFISEQEVIDFVDNHRALFEQIKPSFFEITVAMAFDYFAKQNVDIAVIETGLGGRLDSTNIITPILSVITNIGFDHMNFLGDTLPLIAGEKAGIIKPAVPVVIGQTHPETQPVFEQKAQEQKAPIIFADQYYRAQLTGTSITHSHYRVLRQGNIVFEDLAVNSMGSYQRFNLCTTLQSIAWLPDPFQVSDSAIRSGLQNLQSLTTFLGRWQILQEKPLTITDSAHNKEGLEVAMAQLASVPKSALHVVLGMVHDKDRSELMALFPKEATYYFARPDIPRGLDAGQLQAEARAAGLDGQVYPSVRTALQAATQAARPDDCIYVGGSTFVVAEVV